MSQPPYDDRPEGEQPRDGEQPPSWPAGPPGGAGPQTPPSGASSSGGAYPYAPEPWTQPAPQDPYTGAGQPGAAYSGGYPATGGAPAGGPSAEQSSTRTQAIVSLVLNVLSVVSCCNIFGIVGAVLAGIAVGKIDTDLPQARSLVRWSWIALGGGIALVVLAALALLGLGLAPFLAGV